MTREFYASYSATVRNVMPKRAKPLAQPPLQDTLAQNFSVDISEATIHHFIYGPTHTLPLNTVEEDIDAQPEPIRARGKRHRSSKNSDNTKEARAKKLELQWTE
uniref:Integrase core domain containing protein n=1 Tax=Solanum tuberosum TaxID=4113 RepID=M1DCT9_SOLTU